MRCEVLSCVGACIICKVALHLKINNANEIYLSTFEDTFLIPPPSIRHHKEQDNKCDQKAKYDFRLSKSIDTNGNLDKYDKLEFKKVAYPCQAYKVTSLFNTHSVANTVIWCTSIIRCMYLCPSLKELALRVLVFRFLGRFVDQTFLAGCTNGTPG